MAGESFFDRIKRQKSNVSNRPECGSPRHIETSTKRFREQSIKAELDKKLQGALKSDVNEGTTSFASPLPDEKLNDLLFDIS